MFVTIFTTLLLYIRYIPVTFLRNHPRKIPIVCAMGSLWPNEYSLFIPVYLYLLDTLDCKSLPTLFNALCFIQILSAFEFRWVYFIGSSSLSYLRWFVSEKTVLFYSQRIPVANCPQIYPLEKSLFFCRNKQKYTCLWSINIKFDFSCTVYKAATYSIYFSYGYYCMKERTNEIPTVLHNHGNDYSIYNARRQIISSHCIVIINPEWSRFKTRRVTPNWYMRPLLLTTNC